jgi:hypothetical protein
MGRDEVGIRHVVVDIIVVVVDICFAVGAKRDQFDRSEMQEGCKK